MRHKTLIAVFSVAVATVFLAQPRAQSKDEFGRLDRISSFVADVMRTYEVPGVSVAVFTDFQLEWAKGFGVASVATRQPVDAQTLFQAASISKPVAAAAALQMVQEGKLGLDTPINTYLASWKLPASDLAANTPVTLRRILSHTAGVSVHGFKGYESSAKVPTLVQVLDGQPPANSEPARITIKPGTKFEYSGGAYTIMQLAMTEIAKLPFPEIMRTRVLEPAGMHFSTYEQPIPDALVKFATAGHVGHGALLPGGRNTYPEMAAAGLWTTPSDLARFGMEIERARAGRPGAVLSKEMADLMATPEPGIEAMKGPGGLESYYGHGFEVYKRAGKSFYGHTGGNEGYRCMLVLFPEGGHGVAVMTNADVFEAVRQIVERIITEYGW